MSKKESALFVRLPFAAAETLDRAAETLGMRKKDLVAGLVSKHLQPEGGAHGSYSFRPYDLPEVLTASQAGELLQIDEALVLELAESGKLPGRKLGAGWRFARAALVAWLSTPAKR
jgi:excisionase family DNA binding protein